MVNKKDDWHRERRVGEVVKAGIKCFCGGEAYRDILEVTMNCETFPRVHRIFCPNCGLQMRSPAGNDDDFIVRQWRDISDLHQHQKDGEVGMRGVRINLNEKVRFKPTEYGMDIFYHKFDGIIQLYPQISIKPHFPELDADGYMSMQLWCFMELYGPHMHIGSPTIIENNDIFYEAKQDDKHREATPWQ